MSNPNLRSVAPPLSGRPSGVINKATRMRNEMMREKILTTNIIFKAIDEINERLESKPESVKMSELINIIAKVSPFIYQTVSEEKIEDIAERIATREEAEKEIKELQAAFTQLRAVN